MTFQEWQATRRYFHTLGAEAIGYESEKGWAYEAGFIVDAFCNPVTSDAGQHCFYVPLPQEDRGFDTLAEAEAFLWAEWCQSEING